ncbi:MAG TPA: hypothetical protein VGH76_00785 [Actinomycetospora sp.]|jgi:predicted amidophosphoribosyltransferase|uniref:hypothetical protein n=1 Tax=Actinomycetospora sp. TaxID=1872135 RepID=UPI002F3E8C02
MTIPVAESEWPSLPRVRSHQPRAISCAGCGFTVGGRRCDSCGQGFAIPSSCPRCGTALRGSRGCSVCGAPASSEIGAPLPVRSGVAGPGTRRHAGHHLGARRPR